MRMIAVLIVMFPIFAFADAVLFASSPLWLSTTRVTEGKPVRISTVVRQTGSDTVFGSVTFFADGASVGVADFSLSPDVPGAVVSVSASLSSGEHAISAKITSATRSSNGTNESLPVSEEIKSSEKIVVEPDNDRDMIPDASDTDDDNDGVSDTDEKKNGTNPLMKETPVSAAAAEVAGASTSALIDQAKNIAGSTGNVVFQKTESFRLNGADYFDKKLQEAAAAREAKQNASSSAPAVDPNLVTPKSFTDQLTDASGILAGVKMQTYKILSFIFTNVYAFYLILIFFVLWILRKIWKRYSLN